MRKVFAILFILSASALAQISGAGQLGCSPTPISGTAWNSGTAGSTTQVLLSSVSASAALVQLDQTTTITGGAVTFQLSYDGTNWITVPAAQVLSPGGVQLANPYTLQASTNKPFYIPLAGATNLRLNLSTTISGTGAVTPNTTAICVPNQPPAVLDPSGNLNVNLQTALPAGSNVVGGVTANQTLWNGVALGSPSSYGTSPGAVNVPGVNSFVTNASAIAAVPPVALAQAVNTLKTSSTAVTTLAQAFGSNTTAGNSIACVAFESAAAIPTITDGQSNIYTVAVSSATAPGYTVVVAENITGGTTDTVTETFTSGAGWFACYEFKNGVTIGKAWDYATATQATSPTLNFQQQSASVPLEMVISAVGMGGGTVNATPALAGNPASLSVVDANNVNPSSGGAGAALSDAYAAHTFISGIPSGFIQNISLSASETYSGVLFSVQPIAQTANTATNISTVGGQAISLYSTLFNGTTATATATSFAVRPVGLSGWGDLQVTFAGITGSPSTCTVTFAYQPNTGVPATATQTTISLATPANGTTVYRVAPLNPTGDQIVATYACSVYPTTGTMNVTFAPQSFNESEIQPATWPQSFVASKAFAGSSTTDNAVLPGNASNTVLVTRVIVSCTQTTAGIITLNLVKRSAADTSGTSAAMTAVPDDANYAAAVSAPLSYTGTGPSVGAAVGNVDTYLLGCPATTASGPNDIYVLDRRLKPIVLRGVAQELAVNFGGAITGGNLTVTYEWQERP